MRYSELRKKILSLLSQPPYEYNVPYLARVLGVDRTVIHKVIRPLVKKGIIHKELIDGLTWISLSHKNLYEYLKHRVEFATRKRVDLINNKRVSQTQISVDDELCKGSCKSNHGLPNRVRELCKDPSCNLHNCCVEPGGPAHNIRFPKRAHPYRIQAWRILLRRKQLTLDDWVVLNELFNGYLEDTGHRVILLLDECGGSTLWIGYKHRFTKSGIRRLLRRFNSVFNKANKFTYGVWLTLTVDPKKYNNIIEMRYELQKAWNRFMSWLRKRLGFRPPYIRIIEFTKSGLVHYHVVLLGVRRIGDKKTVVTPELERIGFGKVNFMYTIVNRNGKWIPKKLLEAMKKNVDGAGLPSNLKSYLKKYLVKAFNDLDLESMSVNIDQVNPLTLYWGLNSRFFTYSKAVKPDPEPPRSSKIIIGAMVCGYRFLGSGYIVNPEILPTETDDPPWEYHVPMTFPPIYQL